MKKLLITFIVCLLASQLRSQNQSVSIVLKDVITENSEWAMLQLPQTITDFKCERSAGSIHDFYSEGDYWWPNPKDPDGAYIRKDGITNPDNFIEHRLAMIRFSKIVGSLASAYLLTGDESYVQQAFIHINAWFVDSNTKMNPSLLYAQAIKGVVTGRGIGIIDTIHLMEVAQSIIRMQNAECVDAAKLNEVKAWFGEYIVWLTTHRYGLDEMNAKNNHGSCWVMQVASFAKLTGNSQVLDLCQLRFKEVLLPSQMAANGSFPLELERTKPYGYSLFNLDVMTAICQILSTEDINLWGYTTSTGLNIRKGIDFMSPFVKSKATWTYQKDVLYWDCWPMAQPSLLFGAIAFNDISYFNLWKKLPHKSDVVEVERNMPIRNPLIWIE